MLNSADTLHSASLSILIPAYEYPDGIKKILEYLKSRCAYDFEVLIYDDSKGNCVKLLIEEYLPVFGKERLIYKSNKPRLGACNNWNELIENASKDYSILLHHDEFFLSGDIFDKIFDSIKNADDVDVYCLDVLLTDDVSIIKKHTPIWLKYFVQKVIPSYIFIRNVIGPTSVLITKTHLLPRFDGNLQWLIDVDFYYRLFKATPRWSFLKNLYMGSKIGRKDSITSSIYGQLAGIKKRELQYLVNKYFGEARLLINHQQHFFFRISEVVIWGVFRAFWVIWQIFWSRFINKRLI